MFSSAYISRYMYSRVSELNTQLVLTTGLNCEVVFFCQTTKHLKYSFGIGYSYAWFRSLLWAFLAAEFAW